MLLCHALGYHLIKQHSQAPVSSAHAFVYWFPHRCQDSLDVRGYFYWSLLDNYEWTFFKPRFGLVAVDCTTFARNVKPSALFSRDVIRQNGFSGKSVQHYLKEVPTLDGHRDTGPGAELPIVAAQPTAIPKGNSKPHAPHQGDGHA